MFRVILTKYVTEVNVIYLDSIMRAFSTYEGAADMVNLLVESTIEDLQEMYVKNANISFIAEFSSDPDKHYAIIKKITDANGIKNDCALQLFDIFEIEKTSEGFKYRDDFTIKSAKDKQTDLEYYEIYMNEILISFKEDLTEALLFIDNFIHSHVICEAIDNGSTFSFE